MHRHNIDPLSDAAQPGTIVCRKARGKKYTFMVGGPSRAEAHTFIDWDRASSNMRFFHFDAHDNVVRLMPGGYEPVKIVNQK